MPEAIAASDGGRELVVGEVARPAIWRMLRSTAFWQQRALHPVGRVLLLAVVGVLVCVLVGFVIAAGQFTRDDLLAVALYAGIAAFAWHPLTAAFVVMAICSVGTLFTNSGGDLLELALALGLVAATCAPWVIAAHVALIVALAADLAVNGSALTGGGVYGIAGIGVISFLAGVAFRLVAARETVLVAERARVVEDLESLARAEQERIADELHDGIAHDLTLVLFHARALPKQPDEAARRVSLTTIEESAESALHSIRSLLSLIRDPRSEAPRSGPARYDGDPVKAVAALGTLLTDAGIATSVSAPGVSVPGELSIDPATGRVLTETAIEAVTNILKHAPRSPSARLELIRHPDAVELTVANAWTASSGEPDDRAGGRGLRRARQRLALCDGHLDAGIEAEEWVVRARVPDSSR